MSVFTYEEDKIITFVIKGDFRAGTDFETFRKVVQIYDVAGDTVQFDLTEVKFMDSETYRFIFEYIQKDHLVEWNRKSYVFKRYLDWKADK